MAQPRYADGAADVRPVGGEDQHGTAAAGGPRPWEAARTVTLRGAGAADTGARGRGRLPVSPVRVARTLRLLVDEWGWPVVPGAFAEGGRCSCGDPQCPEPGRHALADASWLAATSDPERVRDRWRSHPEAAVVLPAGWCFDLLEVPERGGREAIGRLEVMGHRLPPVIATGAGRLLFLVSALDRRGADAAETGSGPAPRSAASPRPAASAAKPAGAGSAAARDAAAAWDAAAALAPVTELEPWPASSTWLASAAGCRPETSIWVGGGAPDAPDVVVRRSGLLVAPLLGPEPPGVTRWLVPPATVRRPLPRMEDVLGPIVHACRDAAVRPSYGLGGGRPAGVPRRGEGPPRRPEAVSGRGAETVPVRGSESPPRRPDGVPRRGAVSGREAEIAPARGPESGSMPRPDGGPAPAAVVASAGRAAAGPAVSAARMLQRLGQPVRGLVADGPARRGAPRVD